MGEGNIKGWGRQWKGSGEGSVGDGGRKGELAEGQPSVSPAPRGATVQTCGGKVLIPNGFGHGRMVRLA